MRNELDYSKDGGQGKNGNFWKGWFRYQIDPSEYEKNLILILPAIVQYDKIILSLENFTLKLSLCFSMCYKRIHISNYKYLSIVMHSVYTYGRTVLL